MIVYLNEGIDDVKPKNLTTVGALRLYLPNETLDVVPRMGRAVIFKSEIIEI